MGAVVSAAVQCPSVDDVVVVSDGSTDNTAASAESAGARVIVLSPNRGKGGAMSVGFLDTEAEVVLFLDADLVGLTPAHIIAMLKPILNGEVASTLGVFGSGRLMTDLAQKIAPFLSGQRGITREVLKGAPDFASIGWGVEIALTRYLRDSQINVRIVELQDVTQVMKEEKLGFLRGFASRLKMYRQIFGALTAKKRW